MGYSFYYPHENKVFVARNVEFCENSLIAQEASGSLEDLEIIQEEDTHPSLDTSLNHSEDDQEIDEPQEDFIPFIGPGTRSCTVKLSFIHNEVWELVDLPPNGKTVGHKWLFKKKTDIDEAVHTYKARLQMDVKTAFLNGYLNKEVYMEQNKGFVNHKFPNRKFGFSQNHDEPCVYVKASESYVTFLILYVDDILIMGKNIPMLQDVKSYLGRCFAIKDLGEAAYILGIKIYRDRSKRLIGLCQSAYIEKILKRFYMENSKRGTVPMQEKLKLSKSQGASTLAKIQRMQNIPYASIMYDVRCTRPDVAFTQNITSRFQQNPGELHWTTVKNILKYLRNTKDMFLVYGGDTKRELRVSCYTDAVYLTDADDMKSQTGYAFILNGGVIDWKSTKQSIFATSSTDAEYIAAFDASKEAVWIRKFISELCVVPTIEEPIIMYCDNTGAIAIAKDHGVTKGVRHFRAKVYCLRETIEMGDVKIGKVDTDDNLADPFTKALAFPKHSELTKKIGMIPASSLIRCQLSVLMQSATPTSKWKLLEYNRDLVGGWWNFEDGDEDGSGDGLITNIWQY
ncbi:retrotransposon protein, putative, ty1-copia subclass [Tanacetum coccineum]